jgi:hypothetical protein
MGANDRAGWSKEVNQSRWRLSLAAVRYGMDCGEAAKIGGMDRRTLRATGFTVSPLLGGMGSSTTGRMVRRKSETSYDDLRGVRRRHDPDCIDPLRHVFENPMTDVILSAWLESLSFLPHDQSMNLAQYQMQ